MNNQTGVPQTPDLNNQNYHEIGVASPTLPAIDSQPVVTESIPNREPVGQNQSETPVNIPVDMAPPVTADLQYNNGKMEVVAQSPVAPQAPLQSSVAPEAKVAQADRIFNTATPDLNSLANFANQIDQLSNNE